MKASDRGGSHRQSSVISRALHQGNNPHGGYFFFDWMLSQDGESKMPDLTGRIGIRKGVQHQPRAQELFQKDFIFFMPSMIGPNLKEATELYHQIFGLHRAR